MDNRILFLQRLSQFLQRELIDISFQCPPPLDRDFWDETAGRIQTGDRETLEAVAAVLRSGDSDFLCVDQIADLLRSQGFDTGACHDF